jgi:ABC-2 type transport system permease protein
MFKDLILLISAEYRNLRNSLRDKQSRTRTLFMVALGGSFLLASFFGALWLFHYFRSVAMDEPIPGIEMIGDLLNRVMLSMVFLVFLSVLIFSNLVTGLSSYFLDAELELLNSAPVRRESLFLSRFFEALLESSWMLFIFGLPILFAFGAEYKLSFSYYPLTVLVMFFFIVIPAALAHILILTLVNSFPARRIRDLLFIITIIAAGIILTMLRMIRPERLVNPQTQETVFEFMLTLKQPMNIWFPSYWASEALFRFSREGLSGAQPFLLLLATTAVFSLFLAYWVWSWIYEEGYSKAQEASKAPISRSRAVQGLLDFLSSPFHPSLKQILLKEVKSFIRDSAQWSQLFLLAALMVIYIFNFRVLPLDQIPIDRLWLKNSISYLNMGLAGFVLSALAARFVYPLTSLEGRAFWIVKSAPISLKRFIWTKFWLAWPGLFIIAEALIIITNHYLKVSPLIERVSMVTIFVMSFGIVGLALGMGALFPRFTIENPAKIAVGFGGVIYMIVAMVMIFLIVAAEAFPTFVYFAAMQQVKNLPEWYFRWALPSAIAAGVFVVAISLAAFLLPVRAGIKYLEEMEF